ncbi:MULTISPECIES: response regulator transcription factor [Methylobacterium]|uniref:Two component transcriptional regulator, winged helix family n=1 Tax=Methylobacterium radiotolerans (strain ATCC 27329 / DSM 1819 / JCM 2831 / NBRC 15690 / NCIMB 10815 / 0-1) TaxID=426355 RepID=B1LTD3_METRJ|nr:MULTISPECIES: response regulator transcription factor [Methylobacterium]ACB23879.1 two component transcriptional regulator, winged helix family [Methylobacterium radiotolerans JCM 2831]KIU35133.1 transcriptional regulator [Methylobacterium radiotolerans]RUP21798.1 MAG: response regulator transcription factor [Methylobacterium sp.]UIY43999.1 response regulator transcription factor [Methylobacterium radiotolerans]GEN00085.1 DNA-binding response regulator [Methylobacterium radiotolerans]
MRVLIVEDEPRIAADIRQGLERAGYVADVVADGEAAWFRAETETYDAMVLDLGLPRLDGLGVLRRLRAAEVALPVLILTARDGWRERVEGIDAGADDYLAKPFRMEELVARLRAILRRTAGHAAPVLRAGAVELDTRTRAVSVDGRPAELTALEYRLLAFLLHRPGQVVPAGELLDHLHGVGTEREANALEALLTRLRRKLGPGVIETRRGQGYLIAGPGGS